MREYTPAAIALLFCLVAWEGLVRLLRVPLFLLPPPSRVVLYLWENPGLIAQHTVPTFIEVVAGFALGALTGVTLAAAISQFSFVRRTLFPLLVASQVVPKPAIAPLILLWTGYGVLPKVLLAALISFFPIVVGVTHGLLAVEPEIQDLVHSLRATRWQILTRVQLYSALPYFFSSLRVAATLSVIGAIVGEFVGASEGLGYLLTLANFQMDTPLMFSSIFVLIVMGVALFQSVAIVERWAIPWYRTMQAE